MGNRRAIFGSGGGAEIAQELSTPLLGQIPLDPSICSGGDTGNPITLQSDSLAAKIFSQIAVALSQTFNLATDSKERQIVSSNF